MDDVACELGVEVEAMFGSVCGGALSRDDDIAGAGMRIVRETDHVSGAIVIKELFVIAADSGIIGDEEISAAGGRS